MARSSKSSAKKKTAKKKAAKKKPTRKKAAKKKAAKKPAAKKKAAKKKATKKPATKKKATKKKATKKKATKKKATKKKAAKKKATSEEPPTGTARKKPTPAPEVPEASEAAEILGRLQFLAHVEEDASRESTDLLARLEETATTNELPAMLGMLAGDDPHGIQWSIFFIAEGFDDDYLDSLLDALPDLRDRAPDWADTAVIRILNTRGHEDDCTGALTKLAGKKPKKVRQALRSLLDTLLSDEAGELVPEQREAIAATLESIGGT